MANRICHEAKQEVKTTTMAAIKNSVKSNREGVAGYSLQKDFGSKSVSFRFSWLLLSIQHLFSSNSLVTLLPDVRFPLRHPSLLLKDRVAVWVLIVWWPQRQLITWRSTGPQARLQPLQGDLGTPCQSWSQKAEGRRRNRNIRNCRDQTQPGAVLQTYCISCQLLRWLTQVLQLQGK